MAKPVCIQIRMTIKKRLFHGWIKRRPCLGCLRGHDNSVEQTNLGVDVIDKVPDHTCTDEGDRHGQEDERFGDALKAATVGQGGNQQPQDDMETVADEQPEDIVAKGLQHDAFGEDGNVILQIRLIQAEPLAVRKLRKCGVPGWADTMPGSPLPGLQTGTATGGRPLVGQLFDEQLDTK